VSSSSFIPHSQTHTIRGENDGDLLALGVKIDREERIIMAKTASRETFYGSLRGATTAAAAASRTPRPDGRKQRGISLASILLFLLIAHIPWGIYIVLFANHHQGDGSPIISSLQDFKLPTGNVRKVESLDQTISFDENNNNVSLVVGFWAEEDHVDHHQHRIEVEAALLSNMDNPFLDQVVVILDSVTDQANCQHFLARMESLRLNDRKHYQKKKRAGGGSSLHRAALDCINRTQGQPTYKEMFQYTLSDVVTGRVVILSNTDQVFDETVELARRVKPNVIFVLSTYGYDAKVVPKDVRKYYKTHLGGSDFFQRTDDYCVVQVNYTDTNGNTFGVSWSWDVYIYDRRTVASVASTVWERNASLFQRPSLGEGNQLVPFHMNEMGAENAALHDLTYGHQSDSDLKVWNLCKLIRTWHFHQKPKTHKWRQAWNTTPKPYKAPPFCDSIDECRDAFY
jgi:hypothetical protein